LQEGGGFDSREDGGDKELVFGLGFSTFIYFLVWANGSKFSEAIQGLEKLVRHCAGPFTMPCPCRHCGPNLWPRHSPRPCPCRHCVTMSPVPGLC
jgi:hypothetical protein